MKERKRKTKMKDRKRENELKQKYRMKSIKKKVVEVEEWTEMEENN